MATKLPKLVLIEWIDPNTISGPGWESVEEIIKQGKEALNDYNISVGFVLSQDTEMITIASHLSGINDFGDETDASGDVTVPMRCIVKLRTIDYRLKQRS